MADQYVNKPVKQKTEKDAPLEKAYACDICGARFSCQLSVHRHKKIHTSQFKCEVCGKHFSSRYDLETRHMHIHTKTLPFKCSICCQAFRLRKSYKEHTCANITSPVAVCDICGDRFLLEIELAKHKETHERKRKANDTEREEESSSEFSKHEMESTSMTPSELPSINTSVLHQPQPENQHHFKYHNTFSTDFTMNNPESNYLNYEQYAPPLTNGSGVVNQQILTDPSVNNLDLSNSNLTNLVPMIQNMQGNEPDVLYGQPTATPGGFLNALQMPDNNNLSLPLSYSTEQQNMVVPSYSIQESYEPNQTNSTYVQLQSNGSDQNVGGISQFSNSHSIDINMYTPTSSMQSMSTSGVTHTNASHHMQSDHKTNNPGERNFSPKKQLNSNKESYVADKKAFTVPFAPKRPFQCTLCPKRYYKQSLVDKHMKIHTNPFVCQICGKKFLSKAALELKHMLVHKTENDLKNNVSSDLDDILSSVSSEDYIIEQKEEDNESNMSDTIDEESSTQSMDEPLSNSDTSNSLSPSHVDASSSRNTPNKSDKPFVCKFCYKSYTLQIHLENHLVIHTNPVICPICGKKFTSQKSLELKHMKVHRSTNQTQHEDDVKPNIHEPHEGNISESAVKQQHDNNKLPDNSNQQEPPYSCTYCRKTYTLKVNLDKHMIFHTNPVICPICGKKFHSKEDLETKHMPVHKVENDLKNNVPSEIDDILVTVSNKDYIVPAKEENPQYGLSDYNPTNNLDTFASIAIKQEAIDPSKKEKTFSCSLCNKSYMLQMHLDKHMVIHNNPFICSHCGKKFGTQLALVTHSKRFHGVQPGMENSVENMDENKEKPSTKRIKCPHCPKKYSHKFNLDAHMRVHTDPVSCQICGKKFASRFILEKMHMPKHEASKVTDNKSNGTNNIKPLEQQYTNSYGNEQWNQIPSVSQQQQPAENHHQQPFANSAMNQSQYSYDNANDQQHQLLDLNQYQYHNQLVHQHQYEVPENNQEYQSASFHQQNFPQTASNQDVQEALPQQSSVTVENTASPKTDAAVTSAENQQETFIPDQLIAQALLKDKPYECNVCKKRYSVKVNLAKHMVIHLNPFECKICGKKFLSKKALEEKHMPVHNLAANKNDTAVDANMVSQFNTTNPESSVVNPTNSATDSNVNPNISNPLNVNRSKSVKAQKTCVCPVCSKAYFSRTKLNVHLLLHTKKYACDICGKTFTSQKTKEKHTEKTHYINGTNGNAQPDSTANDNSEVSHEAVSGDSLLIYSCTVCNKKYSEEKFLKKHMILHTNPFVCKICGRKFSSKHALENKHMLTHKKNEMFKTLNTDMGIDLFKCCFCRKTYTFKKNLMKHLEGHDTTVKCKVCQLECSSLEDKKKHVLEHETLSNRKKTGELERVQKPPTLQFFAALAVMSHPIGDEVQQVLAEKLAVLTLEKLEQEELGAINKGKISEVSEATVENTTNSSWVKCPFCEKRYSQKQYLDRHIVIHTNPFVCKLCGKAFATRYALEAKHMLTHSAETPFQCTICPQGFKELRRLRDHVNKKHSDITPHVCEQCGFRFVDAKGLQDHRLIHIKQKYECGDCRKNYFSQIALTEHMKCHTGQRNVACEKCGKIIVYKSTFDKYLLYTDKENKQYVCQPCSHSFSHTAQFYVIGLMFERKTLKDKKENISNDGVSEKVFDGKSTDTKCGVDMSNGADLGDKLDDSTPQTDYKNHHANTCDIVTGASPNAICNSAENSTDQYLSYVNNDNALPISAAVESCVSNSQWVSHNTSVSNVVGEILSSIIERIEPNSGSEPSSVPTAELMKPVNLESFKSDFKVFTNNVVSELNQNMEDDNSIFK